MSAASQSFENPAESGPSEAEQLGAEITELCSYLYAAEARLLTLIRQFDENEYWADLGLCSCAHWLNFKCGIGMNAAREKVRVAHALAKLPKINQAMANGTLSYSKVRAMTRIANEQYNNREVTHYYDHDGCLVIKARLPAEQGALVVKALEMAMDKDFAEADVPVDEAPLEQTSDEPTPIAVRRADALAEVAETYMNNNESSGSTADRYQVVIHVDGDESNLEDGPHVTAVTSRRVACDSAIVVISEDDNGEPLSIGRKSRTIPPPMRRALRVRDKGCRFPGCTHTRLVDGHHIKHWADGGETSLDNLVLLCRHHHHLVHEGGFVCEKTQDGNIRFRDKRSQPLEQAPPMPGMAANDDVQQWMNREFMEGLIDSESCTAKWYAGERMDWNAAVGNLFY